MDYIFSSRIKLMFYKQKSPPFYLIKKNAKKEKKLLYLLKMFSFKYSRLRQIFSKINDIQINTHFALPTKP